MALLDQRQMDCERLRGAGIRPTTQRLGVMRAIREGGRRHLTPESFHRELAESKIRMSLATVYNTLNHFADAGLLRRVGFGERIWFCTNTGEHYHFFDETTGRIEDVLGEQPQVLGVPEPPPGMEILGIDVVIRVGKAA
ncbi:transcriptional repressor [Paramagnetospirillum kuznetsovii]|uniref:Ferric uptake regulation protein n=1 Tax=Paramagnetospirillum kuznetsovii TaxID=2053833 RepID=A0A364P2A2_9PROT|nr:Fur family transcriptional regulator [Paramagnetospirillum kuznetsovii]RAU23472.1 transcriptional repressor [Paramagnetospirillum kuznetsovii]